MRKLMSVKEVAEMLNVSQWTVYRWKRQSRLPYYKFHGRLRFSSEAVEAWLKKGEFTPA